MRRSALTTVLAAAALLAPAAGSQAAIPTSAPATTASASSGEAAALSDSAAASGQLGAEWSAASGDASPWAQLTFSGTRRIASVQVFGATADATDPAQSTAAALYGTLRFSDGSTVSVPGIAAGSAMPTTVAFTPRSVTWVRLELRRQIASAPVALRELTAYDAGTTPPQWAATSPAAYSATPPSASCSPTTTSAVAPPLPGRLSLACPTPGSSVDAAAVVVVNAPAGSQLTAWLSVPSSSSLDLPLRRAATATADDSGRAVLTADVRRLPQGPFAVKVSGTTTAGAELDPLYAQLFRAGGAPASTSSSPAGSSPPGVLQRHTARRAGASRAV